VKHALLALALATLAAPAALSETLAARQWEVVDVALEAKEFPEPRDVVLRAIVRGPEGQTLEVPGFHDGGKRWVVRVSLPSPGRWSWETVSNQPDLSGRGGEIEVSADPGQRGPVVLDPEHPQRFRFADGSPYFALAFECDWLFALDADDPEGIPKTKMLVDQIAAHGFNQIVMNVYAYDVPWGKDDSLKPEHDFARPASFPFGGTNEEPDFSTLNVEFFQRFDRVMRYLNEKGIVSHLMIYVWNKKVSWPDMYSEADNAYFDYVVARYQAFPNLVWDVSKEALAYGRCDEAYIHDRIRRLRHLDGHRRLLTVHDYGYNARHPEKVDVISVQNWASGTWHRMDEIRRKHPGQPVLNVEHGGYERSPYEVFHGNYTDPVTCLERNYETVFAGVYSTYYWQATSWYVVIPDPMGLPLDQRPHFEYYRHLASLFDRFDYSTLEPHRDLSSSGYSLTNGKDLYLFYVPGVNHALSTTFGGRLSGARVSWFNALTGETRDLGDMELRPWHGFTSPWPGTPSVLILEDARPGKE
jgi:hypothetical protein